MPTIKTFRPYQGRGNVYARIAGTDNALIELGNVGELKVAHEEDVQTLADNRPGGGTYAESRQIKAVTLSATIYDWNQQNLSWLLRGSSTTISTGTTSDEAHTAKQGGLIKLNAIEPSNVTVTSDPSGTTYVDGTDYEVRPEGIFILANGNIADHAQLLVSYTNPDYDEIQALTETAQELELIFGGLNEADASDATPQVIEFFKVQPSVAAELALIADGFGSVPFSATVAKDNNKTGTGVSKYYKISQR